MTPPKQISGANAGGRRQLPKRARWAARVAQFPLLEHTTDTAGYTDLIFALFDLLGMQFSPRIRDLGDQRLHRLECDSACPHLDHLLKGKIKRDLIVQRWDDLLRVAGSLKMGWVTASLLIGKLQSYPRQNTLAQALQEYGKLVKTIFVLRYFEDEGYRKRINAQLNKGEALHALRAKHKWSFTAEITMVASGRRWPSVRFIVRHSRKPNPRPGHNKYYSLPLSPETEQNHILFPSLSRKAPIGVPS